MSEEASEPLPFVAPELECEVVAAAMLDSTTIALAEAAGVIPESFTTVAYAVIWTACVRLFHRQDTVDAIAVAGELRAMNRLESIGGMESLLAITEMLPTLAHAERHALELVEFHAARRLHGACVRSSALGRGGISPDAFRNEVLSTIQHATNGWKRAGAVRASAAVMEWWAAYDAITPADPRPARFGVPSVDDTIGDGLGLEGKKLYVVAARPGMGKTSLFGQAALATCRSGGRTLFYSLEMPRAEVTGRLLSGLARIDSIALARKRMSPEQSDRVASASELLHGLPLWIDDTGGLCWSEIRARALVEHTREPLSLIGIDHLNIIGSDPTAPRNETEVTHLSKITKGAKELAKELNVPVVLLVQLNRAVEQRPNKRPQLSDLRGSGTIEQDADAVIFLYRDEIYDRETKDKGIAEIIFAKQRGGTTPVLRTRFRRELTLFEDLPMEERLLVAAPPANDNDRRDNGLDDAEPI